VRLLEESNPSGQSKDFAQLLEQSSLPLFLVQYGKNLLSYAQDFEQCGQRPAALSVYTEIEGLLTQDHAGLTSLDYQPQQNQGVDRNAEEPFYRTLFEQALDEFRERLNNLKTEYSPADLPFFEYRLRQLSESGEQGSWKQRYDTLRTLYDTAWEKRINRVRRSIHPQNFALAGYEGVDLTHKGLYNAYFNLNEALNKTHELDATWADDFKDLNAELQGLGKIFGMM